MKRRLAAILVADVVGYSRLMGADERGTLASINRHREELIEPKARQYNGRTIKLMGDGTLMEFASAVDAVAFATEIQCAMQERNRRVPENQQVVYRIGINVGDIISEGDDIFGDGVNIAARLEAIAEPGGICVSSNVYDQVKGKLDLNFELLGRRSVKNIAEAVSVYRLLLDEKAGRVVTVVQAAASDKAGWRRYAAVGLTLVLLSGGIIWWHPWASDTSSRSVKTALVEKARPPLNETPSIAVLPFINMSDDKAQEYFSDGMTEDLITDLSKISGLTVISRTSTSRYKGKKVDIREVGKALNVRYVVEGSVRKAGEQLRINAQLVDAATGGDLWAERYDGNLKGIFSLEDKVLNKITGALTLKLSEEERRRLSAKGTRSVAAHDLYMRGLFEESAFTRDGNREAIRLYEQALSIDPNYALPYTRIANILELNSRNGWSANIQADLKKAVELAGKAAALDPQNPKVYWSLGRAYARFKTPGALERGIKALKRAIELDPNFADAYAFLAVLYVADGRAEDGLRSVETAMRLNPRYPFWYLFMRGITRYVVEDYDAAISDFEGAAKRSPTALFVRWWLAASYAQVGRMEDAEWQLEEMKAMGFKGNIATIIETQPIQDPRYLSVYKEGLRKAGIPE
ncbi:MAG: adenylate/guanylate cyclase domain-containing protein [Pseudolabrys sp.]